MLTRMGLCSEARWSDSTLELMVALKRYVCRPSLGSTLRILSRMGPKSRSSSLSASSITRYFRFRIEKPFVFSRWSNSRPGVATMTWGFFPRAIPWGTISMPPTKTAHLTLIREPRASTCCAIWTASSRVGARMRPKKGWGFSIRAISMGRTKAAVFPEPVSARPILCDR
jgi:hypothetical protein